jgi:hypothetical protein
MDTVKELLQKSIGVAKVLDARSKEDMESELGQVLGHPRSGQLLAIATPKTWFAYPYWLDDQQAPDFASCVDIFNKPGFDPCEMLLKEGWRGRVHMIKRFLQMKLGIRAPFDVISTRYERIRGSRALWSPSSDLDTHPQAICISSWKQNTQDDLQMVQIKDLILEYLK